MNYAILVLVFDPIYDLLEQVVCFFFLQLAISQINEFLNISPVTVLKEQLMVTVRFNSITKASYDVLRPDDSAKYIYLPFKLLLVF